MSHFLFQTNVKQYFFPKLKKTFSDFIFSYDNSLTSIISIKLVKKDTTVETVLLHVLQIVTHVDTRTASVLVRRDGWDTIVQKVNTIVTRKLKTKLPWKN